MVVDDILPEDILAKSEKLTQRNVYKINEHEGWGRWIFNKETILFELLDHPNLKWDTASFSFKEILWLNFAFISFHHCIIIQEHGIWLSRKKPELANLQLECPASLQNRQLLFGGKGQQVLIKHQIELFKQNGI